MNTIAQTEKGPIEYRVVGQGPAVLVLNGGHQRFFVEHGYQLIIPSRPGYGNTPSSTGRTAEAFADALIPLLDQLQLEQVIVLGISVRIPPSLRNERRFHCNSEKSEREALEHSDITPHSSSFTTKTGRVPTRALPMVQRGR
jgi:hypothetical protein